MARLRHLISAVAMAASVAALVTVAPPSAAAAVPLVRASPTALHFISGELGHAEAQTVSFTNVSPRHLDIRFLPAPPDGGFSHGHSSCPHSLAPHESCEITVWFKPAHWGLTSGRLVYVVGHADSTAYQVHLAGEAHRRDADARLGRR
jgi:hypothetical protein